MSAYISESMCAAKSCEPVRDTPEIRRVLNDLDDVICRYDSVVNKLSDRLSCIAIPMPPAGNTKEETLYNTSLANDINSFKCRIRNITNDLESLYERLEI